MLQAVANDYIKITFYFLFSCGTEMQATDIFSLGNMVDSYSSKLQIVV